MKTCKTCGKEIFEEGKFCERCAAMTPEERKKSRPERKAYILYITDLLLIVISVLAGLSAYLFK